MGSSSSSWAAHERLCDHADRLCLADPYASRQQRLLLLLLGLLWLGCICDGTRWSIGCGLVRLMAAEAGKEARASRLSTTCMYHALSADGRCSVHSLQEHMCQLPLAVPGIGSAEACAISEALHSTGWRLECARPHMLASQSSCLHETSHL